MTSIVYLNVGIYQVLLNGSIHISPVVVYFKEVIYGIDKREKDFNKNIVVGHIDSKRVETLIQAY